MKYLITGSKGQLGKEYIKYLANQNSDYFGFDIDESDIGNLFEVESIMDSVRPDVVINCAAYNNVDAAESDFIPAFKTNSVGVANLAYSCYKRDILLVHYSSDYVFDGIKNIPYTEKDTPNPLGLYAKSKYFGEVLLTESKAKHLLFRVSWLYGEGTQNFIYKLVNWAKNNDSLKISADEVSVPTSVRTVVQVTMQSIERGLQGLFHLTNSGYCSRYDWAKHVIKCLGLKNNIIPCSRTDFNLAAPRPAFSAMDNSLISGLLDVNIEDWHDEVEIFLNESSFINQAIDRIS